MSDTTDTTCLGCGTPTCEHPTGHAAGAANDAGNAYFDGLRTLREHGSAQSLRVVRDVERAQAMGMAYVWGWQDREGECDSDVSLAFGYAYALHALDFETGSSVFKRNVKDAFERWRAGEAIC